MWWGLIGLDDCSRGNVNFVIDDNCTIIKYHTDWVVVVYNTVPQNPLITGFISHNTPFSTETCTFLSPIDVLWNTGLVHQGICEMGLFTRDYRKLLIYTLKELDNQLFRLGIYKSVEYGIRQEQILIILFTDQCMYVCVSRLFWRRILTAFLPNLMASLFA